MSNKKKYSFSRLTSWETCKHEWKRKYIDNDRGEDNFFNTFGTLGHDILEKVDRKETIPALSFQEWDSRYKKEVTGITHKWMANWKSGADNFFKNFKGWRTEAVWIEEHIFVERPNYTFHGFVDRMGRTKNGDLIMTDYKCAKPYTGATLKEKARQMYLYTEAAKQTFGKYPKSLIFFHFRQNHPQIIPFKMEDLEEAWAWADKMVSEIEDYEGDFPMSDNGYFCEEICGFRNSCTKQFKN